jgi:hypothetical protein
LLDLALAFNVVGEEVAGDLDVLVIEVEVRPKELDEQSRHFGIRVREADLVAIFGTFSPIEHASGHMEWLATSSELAAFVLSEHTCASPDRRVDGSSLHVAVEGLQLKRCLLLLGELDVSDPTADRRE